MRPLFWVAINLIGFAILLFMYINKYKRREMESEEGSMFRFIMLSIMLYIFADTGLFLFETATFDGAREIIYAFTILYYLAVPLPFVLFLVYCDDKIFIDKDKANRRTVFYLLPYLIYVVAVLITPLTHQLFYINESNMYVRGEYFWVYLIVPACYAVAIYPLALIKTKGKKPQPKTGFYHVYLFPLPAIILAVIQLLYYGVLLLSIGFVFSAFAIFIHSLISGKDERSLALRSNYLNTILFISITAIVMAGMFILIGHEADIVSRDYAAFNSIGTANMLETYLNKEIGVLGSSVHSQAIREWASDEKDSAKKEAAFNEMKSMLNIMYSDNVYFVTYQSGNEYSLDSSTTFDEFESHASISRDNAKDAWVYELLASRHDYNLNVDTDKKLQRTRVWLNYKIIDNMEVVGIICTGMEISRLMEQILIGQHESMHSQVYVINEHGTVLMNSALIGQEDILVYGEGRSIFDEVTDRDLISELNVHLIGIRGYFGEMRTESTIVPLMTGTHGYATITPIGTTNWTLVMLYDSSALFGTERLLPLFIIIAVLLILFAYISNRITGALIFKPIGSLVASLHEMRENSQADVYGMERGDEIGLLSNAIAEYFIEGHHDALTGLYNRRYIEEEMGMIINTLQRSGGGMLSVLMMDIDFFKRYNDTYGHPEGDKCLIAVAKAISGAITRIGDFAARYGGEEFLVVLPNTDAAGAKLVAERLIENVRTLGIPHKHNNAAPYVTMSVGGVSADTTKLSKFEDFVSQADDALYISKNSGRNRYTQYERN